MGEKKSKTKEQPIHRLVFPYHTRHEQIFLMDF